MVEAALVWPGILTTLFTGVERCRTCYSPGGPASTGSRGRVEQRAATAAALARPPGPPRSVNIGPARPGGLTTTLPWALTERDCGVFRQRYLPAVQQSHPTSLPPATGYLAWSGATQPPARMTV